MVELFGKTYYIDVDGITDKCRTGNTIKEEDGSESLEINIFKYDIIKMCLERVLGEVDEIDEEMAMFGKNNITISYATIEKYPINSIHTEEISSKINDTNLFLAMHQSEWNSQIQLNPYFKLKKNNEDIMDYRFKTPIDIIFYDAFSPNSQPELWSENLFEKLYHSLNYNGILTTYCAKGQVKRNFKKVGFEVLSLPGPIGKREMTLCVKNNNNFSH